MDKLHKYGVHVTLLAIFIPSAYYSFGISDTVGRIGTSMAVLVAGSFALELWGMSIAFRRVKTFQMRMNILAAMFTKIIFAALSIVYLIGAAL